jgi:PQQ-like domain
MVTGAHERRPARSPLRRALHASLVLAALALASQAIAGEGNNGWTSIGRDPENTRYQPFEAQLSPTNVARLAPKWIATTAGDVSATPAVAKGAVYFPDWGGKLWKLDADTGAVIWSRSISDYTGIPNDISRTSPSLAGNTLVVGDLLAPNMMGIDGRRATCAGSRRCTRIPRGSSPGPRFSPRTRSTSASRHVSRPTTRPTSDLLHLPRSRRRPQRADGRRPLALVRPS